MVNTKSISFSDKKGMTLTFTWLNEALYHKDLYLPALYAQPVKEHFMQIGHINTNPFIPIKNPCFCCTIIFR